MRVTAPSDFTVNAVGTRTAMQTADGRTTTTWVSDRPVEGLNVVAGRWAERRQDGTAVFYHPRHTANVDQILGTLVAARARYSEWFSPYPWPELRLSEFPDLETDASAYATNISFSEGIGFLAGGSDEAGLAFSVTAHEAAHEWWGHLVTVGEGPGTDLLVEGLANYSTLLLHETERGAASRSDFARQLERYYLEQRRSGEQPLLASLGENPASAAALSQKGAMVLWLLHRELGRDRMLRGLHAFAEAHIQETIRATPQALIAALRGEAVDTLAFDLLVDQWMQQVVLPEYQLSQIELLPRGKQWELRATVSNVGTGLVLVAIVASGDRLEEMGRRQSAAVPAGAAERVTWLLNARPSRITVDPDAEVLQMNRERATAEVAD